MSWALGRDGIQIWFPESKLNIVFIMCIFTVIQNYCSAKLIRHQPLLEYAENPYRMPNFRSKGVLIDVLFFFPSFW